MIQNLRFIGLLIKLKLSHMMLFRLSFFGAFFADGILFLMQLLAFQVIYSQVDSIGGWNRGQMIIFIGTFSLINALNMIFFFFGIISIPEKINSGNLDQYITKPVNPLLRLTFESVDPGSIPLLIFSILIVSYGISVSQIQITIPLMLGYIILVFLMTLLWYDMELILRSFSFFFIIVSDIDPFERLEGNLMSLNFKIPGVVYKGIYKILFYFVLPYGIMSTIPTQFLSGVLTFPELILGMGTVFIFTAFALWFWKLGLRHYRSASS